MPFNQAPAIHVKSFVLKVFFSFADPAIRLNMRPTMPAQLVIIEWPVGTVEKKWGAFGNMIVSTHSFLQ